MSAGKLPAIQFYPADWKKDPSVQVLDLEHKGAWIELLFAMHESSERGRLVLPNGAPIPDPAIAKMLGIDPAKWKQMRKHLLSMGTASEDDSGVLYNRRMARDDALRTARAEAGRRGGLSKAAKQNPGKHGSKNEAKASSSARRRAGASSSSSSSVAVSTALREKLSNVQQSSGTQKALTNGAVQQDGLPKAQHRTATPRDRAAQIIRTLFHLGHDIVNHPLPNGRVYSENLERALTRWDRWLRKTDVAPEDLNTELELVRFVENFPDDEPITTAVYFGRHRQETRTLCEAERLKRQPTSAELPHVELPPMPAPYVIENVDEKRAEAHRNLAAIRRAKAKAEEEVA